MRRSKTRIRTSRPTSAYKVVVRSDPGRVPKIEGGRRPVSREPRG